MRSKERLQTKDFILIGVLTAVFFVIYMGISMVTAIAGPVMHLFSTAIAGFIGGIVFLLLGTKVPKKGVFTISMLVLMVLMQLAGGSYLPWFISSMLGAVLGDYIASRKGYKRVSTIALSVGVMMLGQSLGNVLPVLLFAERFRAEFIARGVDSGFMDLMINFLQGPMSAIVLGLSFLGGYVGVLFGKRLMRKHFAKAGIA